MAELIEVETERLCLRQWREGDLASFAALNADRKVMAFFPEPLESGASDEVAKRIRSLLAERGWGVWAVEVKGGTPFIGFVENTNGVRSCNHTSARLQDLTPSMFKESPGLQLIDRWFWMVYKTSGNT